jgi:hypothetical protein
VRAAHEPAAEPARGQQPERAREERDVAHWRSDAERQPSVAGDRRADERAQAVRSVQCPCHAESGVPCGPSGDHLARYLRAEQHDVITRTSLHEVIARLDVIAGHVVIQPPGERAAHAAGAMTADQVVRTQLDAGMSVGRIDSSAESVLGGRFDHPTAVSDAFYRGYDEVASIYAREAREREAGA